MTRCPRLDLYQEETNHHCSSQFNSMPRDPEVEPERLLPRVPLACLAGSTVPPTPPLGLRASDLCPGLPIRSRRSVAIHRIRALPMRAQRSGHLRAGAATRAHRLTACRLRTWARFCRRTHGTEVGRAARILAARRQQSGTVSR